MTSSVIYLVCLALVGWDTCTRVRLCAALCAFHIITENMVSWYYEEHILSFDLGLYLTMLWSLDMLLVSVCLMIISGLKKKLIIFSSVSLISLQMIFLGYPRLNDYLAYFAISQAYYMFIESFILISTLSMTSIKGIIRSSLTVFLIVAVHLIY